MKKIMYGMILLLSCNANKESSEKEKDTDAQKDTSTLKVDVSGGCYRMVIARDTAIMNLSVNGKNVTGKLDYKRFEKDSNKGNISGTLDSNKITGWYTFGSEGMVSVRQVVFRIETNKTFAEGYGDMELKGDTAYFKHPHTLTYEDKHPFTRVECN